MDNLKACPFCGSEAAIENDGLYRWAECQNERCRAMSHAFAFLVDAGNGDAIVAANWNTRPLEDAANARAEKAEARAERLQKRLADRDAEVARLTELQRAASEFIGYIKAGNNAKAHLQMLFLEVLINEESKNGAKK